MSSRKLNLITLLFLASSALPVHAAPLEMGGKSESKTAIFGGVDFGLANLSVEPSTGEVSKSGYQLNVKALSSFYLESPWVLDLGLGWSTTDVNGEKNGIKEHNYIRNGFLEFSPRYRPSRWQLGPVIDFGFGSDLTLSQPFTTEKTVGLYPGLQVIYEVPAEASLYRIGGRVTTDLSIPQRTLTAVQLVFQMGWPVPAPKRTPEPTPSLTPSVDSFFHDDKREAPVDLSHVPPAQPMEEEIEVKVIGNTMVQVELSKEITNFPTGSAKLSPRAQRFLRRLGALLNSRSGEWTTIGVEGHTDVRGTLAYNMKLSRRRALSTKKALVEGGVPKERFELAGYGPKIPVDPRNTPDAWAKNRRVEVRIDGAIDTASMSQAIEALKHEVGRERIEVKPASKRRSSVDSHKKKRRSARAARLSRSRI